MTEVGLEPERCRARWRWGNGGGAVGRGAHIVHIPLVLICRRCRPTKRAS